MPVLIGKSETKSIQTIYNTNGTITYLNRHGIRVIFEQTGTIGTFSFVQLLMAVAGIFGFLYISTLVVDLLILYVLPKRLEYQDAKYDETKMFNDKEQKDKPVFLSQTSQAGGSPTSNTSSPYNPSPTTDNRYSVSPTPNCTAPYSSTQAPAHSYSAAPPMTYQQPSAPYISNTPQYTYPGSAPISQIYPAPIPNYPQYQ